MDWLSKKSGNGLIAVFLLITESSDHFKMELTTQLMKWTFLKPPTKI